MLKLLHSSHSGLTKLAKGLYFWPGMTNNIKQLVAGCLECTRLLPSQVVNPSKMDFLSVHLGTPMRHVGVEWFSHQGSTFVVCVDHWSGYSVYVKLSSMSITSVVKCLNNWFNLLGWPKSIHSDGGPQIHKHFQSFLRRKQYYS